MRRGAGYGDAQHQDPPPVPNLPPFQYNQHKLDQTLAQLGARKAKAATLKYVKGYPIVEDAVVPTADPLQRYNYLPEQVALVQQQQERERQQKAQQDVSTAQATWGVHTMRWTGKKAPGWLKYDKKMLRFFGYSVDNVMYSPLEDVRVRRFEFRYYMEDNSLEVLEPQEPNSGLPQGKYLQRHKVKLADGNELKHDALKVGAELTIYSRKFAIVACDPPTREFYAQELGTPQPPDQPMPLGKYDVDRRAREAAEELARSRGRSPPKVKKKNALEDDNPFHDQRGMGAVFEFFEDRKVQEHLDKMILRFYCCWDDTKRTFGQKLPFALHYFLRDDTIEVAELHRRNTGRDPFPLLLSRRQLPKTPNVPPVGGRPLSPRTKRRMNIQYYDWKDMRIGSVVKVYGRDLLIYDMDAFTRSWMKESLKLGDKELEPIPVDFDMGPKRPPLQVPPNTSGIGTEEDSLQNVLHLVPKRPPGDYNNYMENWNKVFRFSARMVPAPGFQLVGPHDAERRFILSFHLLDKTLSIYEPRRENSGMRGGTFLERTKVKKHGQNVFFSEEDFQVGSVLVIYSRAWELLDGDAFTLRYMENEPARFPQASYDRVMSKLGAAVAALPGRGEELKEALINVDYEGQGYVTQKQLHAALQAAGISNVTLHECITVVRQLGADQQGVVVEQLLAALGLVERPPPPAHLQYYQQQHGQEEEEEHEAAYGYGPGGYEQRYGEQQRPGNLPAPQQAQPQYGELQRPGNQAQPQYGGYAPAAQPAPQGPPAPPAQGPSGPPGPHAPQQQAGPGPFPGYLPAGQMVVPLNPAPAQVVPPGQGPSASGARPSAAPAQQQQQKPSGPTHFPGFLPAGQMVVPLNPAPAQEHAAGKGNPPANRPGQQQGGMEPPQAQRPMGLGATAGRIDPQAIMQPKPAPPPAVPSQPPGAQHYQQQQQAAGSFQGFKPPAGAPSVPKPLGGAMPMPNQQPGAGALSALAGGPVPAHAPGPAPAAGQQPPRRVAWQADVAPGPSQGQGQGAGKGPAAGQQHSSHQHSSSYFESGLTSQYSDSDSIEVGKIITVPARDPHAPPPQYLAHGGAVGRTLQPTMAPPLPPRPQEQAYPPQGPGPAELAAHQQAAGHMWGGMDMAPSSYGGTPEYAGSDMWNEQAGQFLDPDGQAPAMGPAMGMGNPYGPRPVRHGHDEPVIPDAYGGVAGLGMPPAVRKGWEEAQAAAEAERLANPFGQLRLGGGGGGGGGERGGNPYGPRPVRHAQHEPVIPMGAKAPGQAAPVGLDRPGKPGNQDEVGVSFNPPPDDWMAAAQARQDRIDQARAMPKTRHTQETPVMLMPNDDPKKGAGRAPGGPTAFMAMGGGGGPRGQPQAYASAWQEPELQDAVYEPPGGHMAGLSGAAGGGAAGQALGPSQQQQQFARTQGRPLDMGVLPLGRGGKENSGGGAAGAPKDPRFNPLPGSIGANLGSTMGGHARKAADTNKGAMDQLSKAQQPKSLWQTTNMAFGGVYNQRSFQGPA